MTNLQWSRGADGDDEEEHEDEEEDVATGQGGPHDHSNAAATTFGSGHSIVDDNNPHGKHHFIFIVLRLPPLRWTCDPVLAKEQRNISIYRTYPGRTVELPVII